MCFDSVCDSIAIGYYWRWRCLLQLFFSCYCPKGSLCINVQDWTNNYCGWTQTEIVEAGLFEFKLTLTRIESV